MKLFWLILIMSSQGLSFAEERNQNIFLSFNTFSEKDSWVSLDKWEHFLVSTILVGGGYALYYRKMNAEKNHAIIFSGGTALSMGLIKEDYDKRFSSSGFSKKDFFFDILGVSLGLIIFFRGV